MPEFRRAADNALIRLALILAFPPYLTGHLRDGVRWERLVRRMCLKLYLKQDGRTVSYP